MSTSSQIPQQSQSSYPASAMATPVPLHSASSFTQRGAGALDLHEMENRKLRTRLSKLEREHEELKRVYLRLSLWTKEKASITGQELYSFLQNSEALPSRDHDDLGPEKESTPAVTESGGGRFFEPWQDLEGHSGPVYVCRFSRRSNLLASGSFDKSVKVWRYADNTPSRGEMLGEHSLNAVCDVSWSMDDQFLVSGGYDKTVKCHDVQGIKTVSSWDLSGFVLSVIFNPLDDNVIWAGTSQSMLHMIDRRAPSVLAAVKNEVGTASMVNALDMPAAFKLFSGDSRGMIKIWDVRALDPNNPLCESAIRNGEAGKPISDLHMLGGGSADEPGLLSVNSYDDVLRIYHRRPSQGSEAAQGALAPPPLRLAHSLLGHRNKNFPIRSHTYRGSRYTARAAPPSALAPDPLHQASATSAAQYSGARAGIERSILLATGSADKSCYLFDIGGPQEPELIQRLEGHTDRVYCANFHPSKALLATASADCRIKIWAPAATNR